MTRDEISSIVKEVMAEERRDLVNNQDTAALKVISTILTSFGLEDDDRKEFRQDLMHLRKWRKSVEQVERVGIGAIITIIAGGILGALWLGFKTMVWK